MPDFSKLNLQRKSPGVLMRQRLYNRYFGNIYRKAATLVLVSLYTCSLLAIHYGGRMAAGEIGIDRKRAESARITLDYIATPHFEVECVEPIRTAFRQTARYYTASPRTIVAAITAGAPRKTSAPSDFRRSPIKSKKNFPIEILRNAREQLALEGHDVRQIPDKERYRRLVEGYFVPMKLVLLEDRLPGICPHQFPNAVPFTIELLARAIARSLDVPLCELNELVYCSQRISEVSERQKRASTASVPGTGGH